MYGFYQGYNQGFNQGNDERIWVQNQASAEAYLMIPNSFVRLWDAEKPIFYEKRTDALGRMLPLDIFEYSKIELNKAITNNEASIVYDEQFKAILERLSRLEEAIQNDTNADDTKI